MERLLNVGAHKNAKEELASKQAEAQGNSTEGKQAARGINRPAPNANAQQILFGFVMSFI